MKNIVLLAAAVVFSSFSFTAVATTARAVNESNSNRVLVKKYFSGKPGYNRKVVKVYQQHFIDDINKTLISNPTSAGYYLSASSNVRKKNTRQHMTKFRRHP